MANLANGGGVFGVPKYTVTTRDAAQQYLVIGCGYLPVDPSVLGVLRQYAIWSSAQVVHCGPIATSEEVSMYRYRQHKLKTWEKLKAQAYYRGTLDQDQVRFAISAAIEEVIQGTNIQSVDWEDILDEELESDDIRLLRLQLSTAVQELAVRAEMDRLSAAQNDRIAILTQFFPEMKFVFGRMDVLDFDDVPAGMRSEHNLGTHFRPSKYIGFAAMMANGPKVCSWPITTKTFKTLKSMHHSWILPHPIIQAESTAKPGLNNANNYFTTGRLSFADVPTHTSEAHWAKHLPGGVAVTLDKDGTFFARNLIIEQSSHGSAFTIEDDVCFIHNGWGDLPSINLTVGITDTHTHYDDKGTMAVFHAVGTEMQPMEIVHDGDASDMEPVSRHLLGKPGQMEGKRLGKCLNDLRDHLAFCRSINPQAKCTLVDSNHHEWLTGFLDTNPSLKDLLSWDVLAKTFVGWNVMLRKAGENAIHRIADLSIRHGDQESVETAEFIFGKYLGGHFHRFRRLGRTLSVGPGCGLGPSYLGQAITAWQNQFFTVGTFDGIAIQQAKTVLHVGNKSKTVFRGQILEIQIAS